jgi:hypothetical protein
LSARRAPLLAAREQQRRRAGRALFSSLFILLVALDALQGRRKEKSKT